MPWPPPLPPSTRANPTPSVDSHPSDHNLAALALVEMLPRVVLASGGFNGAVIAVPGTIIELASVTIPAVSVLSRIIVNGTFWLTSNAQTGVAIEVTDAANVPRLTPPQVFLPNLMGGTYYAGFAAGVATDLAANANPSFKFRAQVVAGGGTNNGRATGTWLLVAR